MSGWFKTLGFTAVHAQEKGYSPKELDMLARLYNINVSGQLQIFLAAAGRSDGGVIGSGIIPLYRPEWRVREHLLFQSNAVGLLQEVNAYAFIRKNFVIGWAGGSDYYFLKTGSAEPDVVFHFCAASKVARCLNIDLFGWLQCYRGAAGGVASEGDLLAI